MLKIPSNALAASALAAACALLPLRALSQTQTSFSEHTLYTDSGPMSIAAHGDFNNDGREDLIVTEDQGAYASAEYLFLSNGDGTYDAPSSSPPYRAGTTSSATSITTAIWISRTSITTTTPSRSGRAMAMEPSPAVTPSARITTLSLSWPRT